MKKATQNPFSFLQISGESGGGQLLRSSLSLAMVTGRPFCMTNIRGKRPKPGLMRQHLTCVTAAAEICGAEVEGAVLGSTTLRFHPGRIVAGDYHFAIGSGGSTTLVLQTLLPALLLAAGPSTLCIEGGTHNPMAPPFEFVEQCFLPVLRRMGVEAAVSLERVGFMQAGGGILRADIQPIQTWKPLILLERGDQIELFGKVLHAHLPVDIANREIATAAKALGWAESQIELQHVSNSIGPGNALLLGARFEHVCEISSGIAQHGKTAEAVATSAGRGLQSYLASGSPVGSRLADQLLLPMAMAGGGVFRTPPVSNHTETNMALIQQFIPVIFSVTAPAPGVRELRVEVA